MTEIVCFTLVIRNKSKGIVPGDIFWVLLGKFWHDVVCQSGVITTLGGTYAWCSPKV